MPELTNFALFFDSVNGLPHLKTCINSMFSIAPEWLGKPEAFMLLNWVSNQVTNGNWSSDTEVVPSKLSENEILTVYPFTSSDQNKNMLSVEEGNNRMIYIISIVHSEIVKCPLLKIENWILRLYESVSKFKPLIAVGSELEFDMKLKTISEALTMALTPYMNCYWVVTNAAFDSTTQTRFQVARRFSDTVLLRDTRLLKTLGFIDIP